MHGWFSLLGSLVGFADAWRCRLFAQGGPLLEELDPPNRLRVILGLLLVIVLGALAIVIAWLIGRMFRRSSKRHSLRLRPPKRPPGEDDWWQQPAAPRDRQGATDDSDP